MEITPAYFTTEKGYCADAWLENENPTGTSGGIWKSLSTLVFRLTSGSASGLGNSNLGGFRQLRNLLGGVGDVENRGCSGPERPLQGGCGDLCARDFLRCVAQCLDNSLI